MKWFKRLSILGLVAVVVALGVAFFVVAYMLGSFVKAGVEKYMPPMTQTTATVAGVDISPFSGKGRIESFVVGNPEGFKTPYAIKVGVVDVEVDVSSLTSDVIVIKSIVIEGAELNFEGSLRKRKSNIRTIRENIEAFTGFKTTPEGDQPGGTADPAATGSGKKIIIENFLFTKSQMTAAVAEIKEQLVLPLPEIRLVNIGKKQKGVTAKEAMTQIFDQLDRTVFKTVLSESTAGGSLKKAAEDMIGDTGSVKDSATQMGKKALGKVLGK